MAGEAAAESVDVLVIEDDAGDALMIREAFGQSKVRSQVHIVTDGEQAMSFLRRRYPHAGAPRPRLILLDLYLPRRNGLEVLAEVKADGDLLSIPVVVLSSSIAQHDIRRSYALHANAYIAKPRDFDGLAEVIRQITDCFLGLIQLPA